MFSGIITPQFGIRKVQVLKFLQYSTCLALSFFSSRCYELKNAFHSHAYIIVISKPPSEATSPPKRPKFSIRRRHQTAAAASALRATPLHIQFARHSNCILCAVAIAICTTFHSSGLPLPTVYTDSHIYFLTQNYLIQ